MSGRRTVGTRCRQIERALAVRVARFGLMTSPRPRDLFVASSTTCGRLAADAPPARYAGREIFQKLLMQH